MKRSRTVLIAALVAIFSAGCGKTLPPPGPIVEVEGVVLLDGRPLNNVEVRFVPVASCNAKFFAKGITNKDGRFTLTCNGKPGACACENRVLVLDAPIPPELGKESEQMRLAIYLDSLGDRPLPMQYASLVESPLVVNVQAGTKEYILELTRQN
jgi:hypothetical protein